VLLVLAGGLLWFSLTRLELPTVRTAVARAASQESIAGSVLDASGYVTARRQATVSAKITGKVAEVLIEEGMRVKEGDVLARLDGQIVNLPARAMKGWNWDGTQMNWQLAPEQYGAIHFHDDDIYDCGWLTDFSFRVPEGLRSGVYAAHVRSDQHEDYIPFYIRPKRGAPTADIAFLASKIAHHAMDNDLTLKAAALQLGFVTEAEFDRVVDPKKMVNPYVATAG